MPGRLESVDAGQPFAVLVDYAHTPDSLENVLVAARELAGSTAAAERLDPEEWTDIMNGAFEPMIRPVYKYEGTVARLMGDAVLAFFGAPIAHEDDPASPGVGGFLSHVKTKIHFLKVPVKRHRHTEHARI